MLRSPTSAPLAIRLTEPITYLKSSATGEDFRGRRQWVQEDAPPAILRGILTLRLNKPTRIKRIEVKLEGKSRTEWPEGIGPRRTETSEENLIISETLTFFNATADAQLANIHRRALSIGPGIRGDDAWDVDEEEEDERADEQEEEDRLEEMHEDERGRGRHMTRTGPRSTSLMPMPPAGATMPSTRHGPGFSRLQSGDITSAYRSRSPAGPDDADDADDDEDNREASGPSGASSSSRLKPRRDPADRFIQARGPSPAYALRDPLRRPETDQMHARGRKTSPRRRMPSGPGRNSSDGDERDITESALSPIASVEGSRFPSPAEGTRRSFRASNGVRFDANGDARGSLNGNYGGSGPSDSEESGPEHRPTGTTTTGADVGSSPRSSLSHRSHLGVGFTTGHLDGTASPHPLHAAIFSAHPSTNNSRTSIQQQASGSSSAQASPPAEPLVEVTRSGSNRSSLVELTPAHLVEANAAVANGVNGMGTKERRDSTSLAGHFASLRRRPSQSSMSQRTPSGTGSPADSTNAVHQYGMSPQAQSSGSGLSTNGRDERGRKGGKFSIANALRSISRATSTSRTRQPSQPPPPAPSSHYLEHTRSTSTQRSGPMDGRMHMLAAEDREIRPFGRGGAGRSPSRTRALSPVQSSDRSDSRSRGRGLGMKVLGLGNDEDLSDGGSHNWKEFKKGVYNYPISFPIPPNAPPTIHADFGSVCYRLTAMVHRPGALSPNYMEEIEVCMIATPQEDDMEESENILVERQWEDQMRYLIALSGKAFTIGGQIPISIRIMPLSKCKIFRLSATIEEKIDYFAMERKVARHEAPKKYPLVSFKNPDEKYGGAPPLLPIISESSDAVWTSPLAAMAVQARQRDETEDDAVSQLLNPFGPWYLETMLQVPDCPSRIKFSTKHETTNMTIAHWLKIVIRVQRGDDVALDTKGKRKQFDIIIETPLHLLECRATTVNNSLPTYNPTSAFSSNATSMTPLQSTCRTHRSQNGLNDVPIDIAPQSNHLNTTITRSGVSPNPATRRAGRSVSTARGRGSESVGSGSAQGSETTGALEAPDTLLERNIVFDRLMSGQESEQGEAPPTYDEALQNRSRSRNPTRGRSGSRLRTEIC